MDEIHGTSALHVGKGVCDGGVPHRREVGRGQDRVHHGPRVKRVLRRQGDTRDSATGIVKHTARDRAFPEAHDCAALMRADHDQVRLLLQRDAKQMI